jgi:toxin YoeB
VSWRVVFTTQARKDAKKLSASGLKSNTEKLIQILRDNPSQAAPPYEKLVGDLTGAYSRRINFQHRLIYQLIEDEKAVKVICMWTRCA